MVLEEVINKIMQLEVIISFYLFFELFYSVGIFTTSNLGDSISSIPEKFLRGGGERSQVT